MEQSCLVCGPDKACEGHPPKRARKAAPENAHIPRDTCPICFVLGKRKAPSGRHKLGGAAQINQALQFGPVWCRVKIDRNSPFGLLKVEDDFTVHGVRRSLAGGLELNTAAGWVVSFGEVWAKCSPAPYAGQA